MPFSTTNENWIRNTNGLDVRSFSNDSVVFGTIAGVNYFGSGSGHPLPDGSLRIV